ncbi:MAG: type II toxin-antitoxin system HicB family antitoxin [Nitrospiraceae bacterium]|nr:type II toxin-antitoxin system HicB family antitoxin [Nitrospiraceae bacterium]
MSLTYPIVLAQEDSKWWAYFPDLPGVYGSGGSEAEAKKDIVEALELYIEDIVEEGKPIPMSHIKKLGTDQIHIAASS